MPDEDTRVSVRLSPSTKAAVDDIKRLGGFNTDQEAIRRAIGDERFIQQKKRDGWTILLRKDNEYLELVWPS